MEIINLTPHAVTFVNEDGETIKTVAPSGTVCRCKTETVVTGSLDGIPTTTTRFGEVEGLPEAKSGMIYIVSSLVAQRVPYRQDVFIPNESVRDSEGRIVGCKSLGHI